MCVCGVGKLLLLQTDFREEEGRTIGKPFHWSNSLLCVAGSQTCRAAQALLDEKRGDQTHYSHGSMILSFFSSTINACSSFPFDESPFHQHQKQLRKCFKNILITKQSKKLSHKERYLIKIVFFSHHHVSIHGSSRSS